MPDALALTKDLSEKKPSLTEKRDNLNLSLNALKSKIESARATANRIKVLLTLNFTMAHFIYT